MGCHRGGRLVALAASCEEIGEGWASRRALHPGVQIVGGPEGITNIEVSGGSIPFAVAAAMTPPRPDCVTANTGRTVELAQLGDAFLNELQTTMLLNHVQHEAVVRGSSEGCRISTTLSTTKVFFLLLSQPRLGRSFCGTPC